MWYEYALFNVVVMAISSLGNRICMGNKWPKLKPAAAAMAIIGGVYLIWDQLVTDWWWEFNPEFVSGWKLGRLPLEEVAFFVTVPWSTLVIWRWLEERVGGRAKINAEKGLIMAATVVGVWAMGEQKWYTAGMAAVAAAAAVMSRRSDNWLRQKNSLALLGITAGLMVVFNGYLTARPVVIYNPEVMTNIRLATIPVEDFVYGWGLVAGAAMVYEKIKGLTN